MEEARSRRDFKLPIEDEILDFWVIEADIANADPRFEFEQEGDQGTTNANAANDEHHVDVVILDAPEQREVAVFVNEEEKE